MQAQTQTERYPGINRVLIAVLAIALAISAMVAATRIADIGQSSTGSSQTVSESRPAAPAGGIAPMPVNGADGVVPSLAADGAAAALIEDIRFLEINTMMPDYAARPVNVLPAREQFFLEANLFLPGFDTVEPVMSADEMLFIEWNTNLPDAMPALSDEPAGPRVEAH